jgi:hypothetical protein
MALRHGEVVLAWGDGEHAFRLDLAGIEELEEKTGRSVFDLGRRASPERRDLRLVEMREIIRLGLIGGGAKPVDALALVKRHLDERPLDESRDTAYAVVLAGLLRVHGDRTEAAEGKPGESQE